MKNAVFVGACVSGLLAASAALSPVIANTFFPTQSNGAIRVSWNYRGGTCDVRYTEAASTSKLLFQYHTSASCDDGSVVVRGLVPGKKYTFEVSSDGDVNWSKPVTGTAKIMNDVSGNALVNMNDDGTIHLTWNAQNGQCYVQYTEANEQVYKYATVADCNSGGVMIGKLVVGQTYRLQFSVDNMNWSNPVEMVAHPSATFSPVPAAANPGGAVKLVWNYRGGACNIVYTEAGNRDYKYSTTASCDEGMAVVGGLVPGQKYRFQIQENGMWSKPVVAVAQ